jgi:hypothetical protein
MQFDEFERRAWAEWERIPNDYKLGVDGLVIERSALPHPELPEVYTLGQCVTESYPSGFESPETTRSSVVLYYGSFFRLSREDPEFDWEQELWETLTHELQHHLESLATDDSLVDMDYAADENFKRLEGEPFDPFFFRRGLRERSAYRVDDEYFIELEAGTGHEPLRFLWDEIEYQIDAPRMIADVTFVEVVDGVENAPAVLHLVVTRTSGWRDTLAALFKRRTPVIAEVEAKASALLRQMDGES